MTNVCGLHYSTNEWIILRGDMIDQFYTFLNAGSI